MLSLVARRDCRYRSVSSQTVSRADQLDRLGHTRSILYDVFDSQRSTELMFVCYQPDVHKPYPAIHTEVFYKLQCGTYDTMFSLLRILT